MSRTRQASAKRSRKTLKLVDIPHRWKLTPAMQPQTLCAGHAPIGVSNGCGWPLDKVERLIRDDAETLAMWRDAVTPPPHIHKADGSIPTIKDRGKAYTVSRLKREAPGWGAFGDWLHAARLWPGKSAASLFGPQMSSVTKLATTARPAVKRPSAIPLFGRGHSFVPALHKAGAAAHRNCQGWRSHRQSGLSLTAPSTVACLDDAGTADSSSMPLAGPCFSSGWTRRPPRMG